MHRRSTLSRSVAFVTSLATIFMLAASAAPAFAGNTRQVSVGSDADGQLPSVIVSAGESIMFPLTVRNNGKQTLNNVVLVVGRDSVAAPENDRASGLVPLPPVDLPTGVSITDGGTGGTKCVGGATLRCTVGSLAARASFAITITISSTRDAVAAVIPTKAVVSVAEIGNDQGSNTDTFAAEGALDLLAFSCDSISAYRTHNQSKTVSTCSVADPLDANGQSASIVLPARLSGIGLQDDVAQACPAALVTCYGPAAVEAAITGDETSDTIVWVIDVQAGRGHERERPQGRRVPRG